MIKIELSEQDTWYLGFAIFAAFVGAGVLGALIAYCVLAELDEIPEGEKPFFTFTTETKEE